MNILSRILSRPQPSLADPLFGPLTHENRIWCGTVAWPHTSRTVSIGIYRAPDGPRDLDRTTFEALRENYPALIPRIQEALFALWAPYASDPTWEGASPGTAADLWSMLDLDGIYIKPDGKSELLFGFAGDFWPDAMFSVSVDGLTVEGIALDD